MLRVLVLMLTNSEKDILAKQNKSVLLLNLKTEHLHVALKSFLPVCSGSQALNVHFRTFSSEHWLALRMVFLLLTPMLSHGSAKEQEEVTLNVN